MLSETKLWKLYSWHCPSVWGGAKTTLPLLLHWKRLC